MKIYHLITIVVLTCTMGPFSGRAWPAHAMRQSPSAIDITTGYEIPSEGYCDQPYVLKLANGVWLCTMTTGTGHEGQTGQHVVSCRSHDRGKTWSSLVDIEPADGPEASWAMPYLTGYGRVYVFYTYNAENRRTVIAGTDYARKRVDTLGEYAFKYSDDGGLTWSRRRWFVPVRETAIDRDNPYQGRVRFFWGVGKPMQHRGAMYLGFSKVGRFGVSFIETSESWFLRCGNIETEQDPAKLTWETLPRGDRGLTSPQGSIAEEVNLVSLSDGSLFCTYRTVAGHPCHAYSRDHGATWTESAFMTYGPGGTLVDHPRAANFVRRLSQGPFAGRYIYWFHNHRGKDFLGRNPAYLLGGVEEDSPDGKVIRWGSPVAVLYDEDKSVRISYPDFIWDEGLYITETQKKIARVHRIPDRLLRSLWSAGPAQVGAVPVADVLTRLGATLERGVDAETLDGYARQFDRTDKDRDGKHTKAEYVDRGPYMTPQARAGIFRAADGNADGVVTRDEYILNRIITDEAKTIVQGMDDDRDGLVERAEFVKHATRLLGDGELAEQVYAALDTNADGRIPIPEYLRVWGRWARAGYVKRIDEETL